MRKAAILFTLLVSSSLHAQSPGCPAAQRDGTVAFSGGSIAMRTPLSVNPDGAAASYTPGDHGFTYIANGVNLRTGGRTIGCSEAGNSSICRREWLRAEALRFAKGSPEFCVYALVVEPIPPASERVTCGRGRSIVGNALGRPKLGPPITAVSGATIRPYASTTSLQHTVGGSRQYLDSATIPVLVAPTSRPELIGSLAWVRYRDRQSYAIIGDTGPRFGEGSIALHRMLRSGAIGSPQPVGPIARDRRCTAAELSLQPPFESRPDLPGDKCRSGRAPGGPADIRAYSGIDEPRVDSVILARVKPAMQGSRVTSEVTMAALQGWAAAAGYGPERLAAMAACLRP